MNFEQLILNILNSPWTYVILLLIVLFTFFRSRQ